MGKRGIVEKLFNGCIVAESLPVDTVKNGLYAPKMVREERYEKLRVVQGDEEVKDGEIIIVSYGKGTTVPINDKDYILINKLAILAIL